ncbi:MAG: DUF1508 domain-containing protein [Maricaulaceae bacterium]
MTGSKDSWDIYTDKRGAHRWRRRASNGNITGRSSEGYVKQEDCEANAMRHGWNGNPDKLGKDDRWETYKDKRGGFRWRRTARNGKITGTSSESYVKKSDCEANAKRNGK